MNDSEFKALQAQMAADHQSRVDNFGVPDRFIQSGDIKFWRFGGIVVPNVLREERFSWPDLVPVMTGDAQIGVARIFPHGTDLVASVSADAACPERLDWELGVDFTLSPYFGDELEEFDAVRGALLIRALNLVRGGLTDPLIDELPEE